MQIEPAHARRNSRVLDLVIDENPRRVVGDNLLDLLVNRAALVAVVDLQRGFEQTVNLRILVATAVEALG